MVIKNKLTQSKPWINKYYSYGTNKREKIGRFNTPKREKRVAKIKKNPSLWNVIRLKKREERLDSIFFPQSNKVWSCESHIVRACGESRKKILFQIRFLRCVRVLLLLLFIFWASIGLAVKCIGLSHAHTHADTFMLLNCPLHLSISKSSSVCRSNEEEEEKWHDFDTRCLL